MALTRQDWEQVKDKFIDTADMLHKHLVLQCVCKQNRKEETHEKAIDITCSYGNIYMPVWLCL